jgi:hypothetical protein
MLQRDGSSNSPSEQGTPLQAYTSKESVIHTPPDTLAGEGIFHFKQKPSTDV